MSVEQSTSVIFISLVTYYLGFWLYLVWCNSTRLFRVEYRKRETYRARLKLAAIFWPIMIVGILIVLFVNNLSETIEEAELFKRE